MLRRIASQTERAEKAEAECVDWKTSSMLDDGSGDPATITPDDNEKNVKAMRAERDALAKACRPFDVLYAVCGVREYDKLASFTDKDGHCRWFTVGDLQRLHEALDAPPTPAQQEPDHA